jgi:hypothetical protein
MFKNHCLLSFGRASVSVRSSGDQLLRPTALLKRLTGAVYHSFLFNDLPVALEHVPAHQCQLKTKLNSMV